MHVSKTTARQGYPSEPQFAFVKESQGPPATNHQLPTANRGQPPTIVQYCFCGFGSCPCLDHEAESVPVNAPPPPWRMGTGCASCVCPCVPLPVCWCRACARPRFPSAVRAGQMNLTLYASPGVAMVFVDFLTTSVVLSVDASGHVAHWDTITGVASSRPPVHLCVWWVYGVGHVCVCVHVPARAHAYARAHAHAHAHANSSGGGAAKRKPPQFSTALEVCRTVKAQRRVVADCSLALSAAPHYCPSLRMTTLHKSCSIRV